MSSTHPAPWQAVDPCYDENARRLSLIDGNNDEILSRIPRSIAEQIVSAVNSQADLLAACKAAAKAIEENIDDEDTDDGAPTWAQALHMQLEAALSKAEGGAT